MRKLIYILLLFPVFAQAQVVNRTTTLTQRDSKLDVPTILTIPKSDNITGITGLQGAPIRWDSGLKSILVWDGSEWVNPRSVTLTGAVTGSGTGTIELTLANDSVKTQHLADTAVTTDKIRDGAVTLGKMADMNRGKLLGLGGITSNPWVPIAVYPGYSGWSVSFSYSVNHVCFTSAGAYRAKTSVPEGYYPPDYPQYWEYIGPYRVTFSPEIAYDAGDVAIYAATSTAYQATSNVVGLAPDETPPSDPGTPVEITLDNTLSLGLDNVLRVNQSTTSIAGLVIGGVNVTITGGGTTANPFIINSTGGGGGGGSTTLAGLTDVTLSSPTSGQYLRYNGISWENSAGYTLPVASASTLGGVRVGSGLSINPATGVLSATGTSASVFTRTVNGLVPAPGGSGTTRYLREDGTWQAVSGGGGSVSLLTAGSSSVGAIRYAGVAKTNGQLYGGVSNPTNSTRLNFDGTLHAYDFVGYGLSDSTKKEDIVRIDSALEKVSRLGGYRFKWKEGNENYSGYDYGLIAQEVEKVLPDAVVERNGVKAIRSSNQVISLLVEAVKELDDKVEDLELKYDSLLKRLEALENEKK